MKAGHAKAQKIRDVLIIGGTIKAATTSLFNIISAHPQVCGSSVKETDFFMHEYTGQYEQDIHQYGKYFLSCNDANVLLESSPAYLSYRENIAQRISALLPDARVIFILRNPVDRLYSHYHFAKGKLELPASLTFDEYIELCESYERTGRVAAGSSVPEKHLRGMLVGKYADHLESYFAQFRPGRLKIVFFDDLKNNPRDTVDSICQFACIDPAFYDDFKPVRSNVTYSARLAALHFLATRANRRLEIILRKKPAIKRFLVKVYKSLNQRREGYEPMQEETRVKLLSYYAPSNARLKAMLNEQSLPAWL